MKTQNPVEVYPFMSEVYAFEVCVTRAINSVALIYLEI